MEAREICSGANAHLHTGLVGLLQIAAPELIEVVEQTRLGLLEEIELEHVAWLDVAETGFRFPLLPPVLEQPGAKLQCTAVFLVRRDIAQSRATRVLQRVVVPLAHFHGCADLQHERTVLFRVCNQRLQPTFDAPWIKPVDHRTLGQICKCLVDPRNPAVQHQTSANELPTVVEPADRFRRPIGFHVRPLRQLQE